MVSHSSSALQAPRRRRPCASACVGFLGEARAKRNVNSSLGMFEDSRLVSFQVVTTLSFLSKLSKAVSRFGTSLVPPHRTFIAASTAARLAPSSVQKSGSQSGQSWAVGQHHPFGLGLFGRYIAHPLPAGNLTLAGASAIFTFHLLCKQGWRVPPSKFPSQHFLPLRRGPCFCSWWG